MQIPESSPSKVIVGLDLKGRCHGALAWLSAIEHRYPGALQSDAVHASTSLNTQILGKIVGEDEMQARVLTRLHQVCKAQAPNLDLGIEVLQDQELPESLEFYAERHNADLLVLGRVAPKNPTPFIRLGSVTRNILQSLMLPTIVVPSDYEVQDFRPGPIMVAVDGTDTSNAALAFGRCWSERLQRKLFLAHVLPNDSFLGEDWLAPQEQHKARTQLRTQSQTQIDLWLRRQGQQDARLELAQGDTFQELRYLATHHEACMVVTGSRCLDTSERLFSTSMSSALAASCDRPVAVVPSTPWMNE